MREITALYVHHSASPLSTTAKDISRMHTLPPPLGRGWRLGTGYHRIIEADGSILDGRKIQWRGAHAKAGGSNTGSIGICVIGDNTVGGCHWTPAQNTALAQVILYQHGLHPLMKVGGHRDAPGAATACPGLDIALWCKNRLIQVPLLKDSP